MIIRERNISWVRIKQYYGLEPPYDYGIAILFFISFIFLAITILFSIIFFVSGKLSTSYQAGYFLYLFILFVVALLSARLRAVSMIFILVGILELFAGIGTFVFLKTGLADRSFIPRQLQVSEGWTDDRFEYHPMLIGRPKKSFKS